MSRDYANHGVVVGEVTASDSGAVLPGCIVTLASLTNADGLRLRPYNERGIPAPVSARTDGEGRFALWFLLDPTLIGEAIDLPAYKVSVRRAVGSYYELTE